MIPADLLPDVDQDITEHLDGLRCKLSDGLNHPRGFRSGECGGQSMQEFPTYSHHVRPYIVGLLCTRNNPGPLAPTECLTVGPRI